MKYLLYVDFKASHNQNGGIEWIELNARNILEAMSEADTRLEPLEDVYLARILEKKGKDSTTTDRRVTFADLQAILCNRGGDGWHVNDEAHGEAAWTITWARDRRTGCSWAAAF